MIEISIAVVAVAFVVLVIFLVKVLISVCRTLDRINRTLPEVQALLRETQKTTSDINSKLESLDGIFKAISLVGDKAFSTVRSFRGASDTEESFQQESFSKEGGNGSVPYEGSEAYTKINRVMGWLALVVNVWDTINKKGGSR